MNLTESNLLPRHKANITPEKAQLIDQIICTELDLLTKDDNKIWSSPDHDRREYVHSFFQYPAMMVPVVQKRIIEIILSHRPDINSVFDPFIGSGTSLVACMENGIDCYGQDVNPLAVLVAKTRTGPFYFKAIAGKKVDFFSLIANDKSSKVETNFPNLLKWFREDVAIELSKIVRAIRNEPRLSIRRFYWVILAETIRLSSNDRTSTFKLHARPISEVQNRKISPVECFKKHFEKCLFDIEEYANLLNKAGRLSKGAYTGDVRINLANSREGVIARPDGSQFELLVTSPPYGDNKTTVTYGQYSYLPLQWIDLNDVDEAASQDYLATTSEIDSRGLGGRTKRNADLNLQILFSASPTFERVYNQVARLDKVRLNKVVSFFFDIYESIQNSHAAIKINSYQIWTVGNRTVGNVEIPNNKIISEFIISMGNKHIKTINREILNRRMAKRNNLASLMTFEDIIIFRKID